MKLINSNRFYLAGTSTRFLHLATVHNGVREFMCFVDRFSRQVYIEEITGGQLEFINDDSLAQGISDFLTDKNLLDMTKPLLSDDEWLRYNPKR